MKIARLLLVLLALTATTLSAAPKKRTGGSQIQSKTTAGAWYYCYATPWDVVDCGEASDYECWEECGRVCGGVCDWETPIEA